MDDRPSTAFGAVKPGLDLNTADGLAALIRGLTDGLTSGAVDLEKLMAKMTGDDIPHKGTPERTAYLLKTIVELRLEANPDSAGASVDQSAIVASYNKFKDEAVVVEAIKDARADDFLM
mmetsp:Transcript_7018/g.8021  ORF Transcript_7018/g.8021 Transcript_7018/m.8021 type:complete len:119 (-) Transcript_7018:105-461(-)